MASVFHNLIAGMAPREKRMLSIMGMAVLVFVVFLAVFFVGSSIGELEEDNAIRAETIKYISIMEPKFLERQKNKSRAETRGQVKPTPLRTLVDGAVKKLDIEAPDTKEIPDMRSGDFWVIHAVEVSIRRIGLENLTKFMEDVESNRRKFPIAVTKLEIRKRRREDDAYDVKMTISTYEISTTPDPGLTKANKKGGRS